MRIRSFLSALPLAMTMAFALVSPAPAAQLNVFNPSGDTGGPVTPPPASAHIYKLPFPQGMTFTMCQGHNQCSHTANGK